MLRLIQASHPNTLGCHVVLDSMANQALYNLFNSAGIPIHIAKGPFQLYRMFRQVQPDIAYLFARIHVSAIWATIARLARIPVIVGPERGWGGGLTDWISQRLGKFFLDGYIANSHSAAKYLEKAGISTERIFVVYNGIDESEKLDGAPISEQRLGSPSIVCVANILPLKGQNTLLQAIHRLRRDFPQIQAVLIGRDYTGGKFFYEIEQLGLADTYTWTGFVPNVYKYLSQADVFVLPSIWGEGMPTVLLEAMLAGKPVIASNTGGIAELIMDGKTGLLVPPGDANALADKIKALLEAPSWGRQLSQTAYKHVRSYHSVSSMVEGHIKAFENFSAMKKQVK